MIDLTLFKNKKFAIFGLGKSGISTASALNNAGAETYLWDDNKSACEAAQKAGFNVHDFSTFDFSGLDGLILSPGVPLTHPKPHWSVNKANDASIPILGDVELFLQAIKQNEQSKLIAVTGTNGKSTTVSLIHHILKHAGLDAHLGGNIGTTTILNMPEVTDGRIYIAELSSYQIDLMPSLQQPNSAPNIAVLTNISADHIDRHGSIEHYAQVKSQIFKCQKLGDLAIIGIDDEFGKQFSLKYKSITISSHQKNADFYCENQQVNKADKPLFSLKNAPSLQGVHNAQNAAIAYNIAKYFNIDDVAIQTAMENFKGLAHRMEYVGKIKTNNGDILFINDSKATNVEAVKSALSAYDNVYWLAGGLAKDGGLQPLLNDMQKIKKAYLFGASAQSFASDLKNNINSEIFLTMQAAINKALTEIMHTDVDGQKVILLSPAAASFDQFKDFEQRGDNFKQMAQKLGAKLR